MKKILLALCSLLLFSCGKNKSTITIDNPSSEALTIKIDESLYSVGAGASTTVDFSFGKHELNHKEKKREVMFEPGKDYLLNPTNAVYVMKEFFFLDSSISDQEASEISASIARIKNDSIVVDGYRIYGNVKKDSSFLIERIWDFSPDEALPSQVEQTENITSKVKAYREMDFLKAEIRE